MNTSCVSPLLSTERDKDPKFRFHPISNLVNEAFRCIENSETVVLLPPLTISSASPRIIGDMAFVPLGVIDFVPRPAPSNPFDIELFFDDFLEVLDKLGYGEEEIVVAVFDPIIYCNQTMISIPIVRVPKSFKDAIAQNKKYITAFLLYKEWILYEVDKDIYVQIGVYGFIKDFREFIEPSKASEEGFRYHGIPWYRYRAYIEKLANKARKLTESTLYPPIQDLEVLSSRSVEEFVEQQISIGAEGDVIAIEIGTAFFIDVLRESCCKYVWIPRGSNLFLSALYRVLQGLERRFRKGILVTGFTNFRECGFRAPRSTSLGSWLWLLRHFSRDVRLIVLNESRSIEEVRNELLKFIST